MNLTEATKYAKGRYGQNLSQVSLRAACERGALKARKQDGIWEVSRGELDKYLKSRPRWWKPGSSEQKLTPPKRPAGSGGKNERSSKPGLRPDSSRP